MPTLEQIMTWAKENQLMLGLIGSAAIGTMPEKLPGFRDFPQWVWTWVHDAAKTFLNFKRGMPDAPLHLEKKDPVIEKKPIGPVHLNG